MTIGHPDFLDPTIPQANNDLLASGQIAVGSTAYNTTINNIPGVYRYVMVVVTPTMASCEITASAGQFFSGASGAGYVKEGIGTVPTSFIYPTIGFIGGTLRVSVQNSPAVTNGPTYVSVYGLRVLPDGLRFDGSLPPQNTQAAAWTLATGITTVIAAPAGGRILIGDVISPSAFSAAGAYGTGILEGSIGGVTQIIAEYAFAQSGAVFSCPVRACGVLLDYNTGVSQTCNNAIAAASAVRPGTVFYDVVI